MKKFVITRFAATDIAALSSVNFDANGESVIVTGRNGAGKSTIQKAIMWTLLGGTADGEKLIPIDGAGLPIAEMELYDGEKYVTLRKEMEQYVDSKGKISRSVNSFMCGVPVTQKEISAYYEEYLPATIFNVQMNLGKFFQLKMAEQRAILTKLFANINDAEIMAADDSLKELKAGNVPVERYGDAVRAQMKRVKADLAKINPQIEVLTRQMINTRDDRKTVEVELVHLETELGEVTQKIANLRSIRQTMDAPKEKLKKVNAEYWQLESERAALENRIAEGERQLENLRADWMKAGEICPTCGQPVSSEHTAAIRDKIAAEGQALKRQVADEKKALAELRTRREIVHSEQEMLAKKVSELDADFDTTEINSALVRQKTLQFEIGRRRQHNAQIETKLEMNATIQANIDELIAQEKTLGRQLAECEKQLALAEKFVRLKMQMVSDAINEKFQHVKFKMFERLKSGDVVNTCEATLDGVPYACLSKGERLKVALDVLNAFQNYYGVIFPLIIDDAESYTSNSFVDVPNQLILLKAVEGGELEINCGKVEGRRAA